MQSIAFKANMMAKALPSPLRPHPSISFTYTVLLKISSMVLALSLRVCHVCGVYLTSESQHLLNNVATLIMYDILTFKTMQHVFYINQMVSKYIYLVSYNIHIYIYI